MPSKKHLLVFLAGLAVILEFLAMANPVVAASKEKVCTASAQPTLDLTATPVAGMIFDNVGNLYGTTPLGGWSCRPKFWLCA
jgi:hypothetical protein